VLAAALAHATAALGMRHADNSGGAAEDDEGEAGAGGRQCVSVGKRGMRPREGKGGGMRPREGKGGGAFHPLWVRNETGNAMLLCCGALVYALFKSMRCLTYADVC
jgi:hypothetical protein